METAAAVDTISGSPQSGGTDCLSLADDQKSEALGSQSCLPLLMVVSPSLFAGVMDVGVNATPAGASAVGVVGSVESIGNIAETANAGVARPPSKLDESALVPKSMSTEQPWPASADASLEPETRQMKTNGGASENVRAAHTLKGQSNGASLASLIHQGAEAAEVPTAPIAPHGRTGVPAPEITPQPIIAPEFAASADGPGRVGGMITGQIHGSGSEGRKASDPTHDARQTNGGDTEFSQGVDAEVRTVAPPKPARSVAPEAGPGPDRGTRAMAGGEEGQAKSGTAPLSTDEVSPGQATSSTGRQTMTRPELIPQGQPWQILAGDASPVDAEPTPHGLKEAGLKPGEVISQIVRHAELLKVGERTEVRMQLEPPSLGRVVLHLSSEDNRVAIRLLTETLEARDLVQANLSQLHSALQDQGIRVDRLTAHLGSSWFGLEGEARGQRSGDDSAKGVPRGEVNEGEREVDRVDAVTHRGDGRWHLIDYLA
ncbi:MAG: flagellar hook-length control protein FliK [Chloroflexota bacterium]